jgi:hypothetical protein
MQPVQATLLVVLNESLEGLDVRGISVSFYVTGTFAPCNGWSHFGGEGVAAKSVDPSGPIRKCVFTISVRFFTREGLT